MTSRSHELGGDPWWNKNNNPVVIINHKTPLGYGTEVTPVRFFFRTDTDINSLTDITSTVEKFKTYEEFGRVVK